MVTRKTAPVARDVFEHGITMPSPFSHDASDAIQQIVEGVSRFGSEDVPVMGSSVASGMQALQNTVLASYQEANSAQPAPANVQSGFRLVDYFAGIGDVYQTVQVPTEVLCKEVRIDCKDDGAKKVWEEIWDEDGVLSPTDLFAEFFYGVELYGNCYPLIVGELKEPMGIAMLPPHSMWVGRQVTNQFGYALIGEGQFDQSVFKDMVHELAFNSFNVDLNTQIGRYYRVPIAQDKLSPITARKAAFQRYATPPLLRASRNILYRLLLESLRDRTVEGFINQLIHLAVGAKEDSPQMIAAKIKKGKALMDKQKVEKTGSITTDYTYKFTVVSPAALDVVSGHGVMTQATQAIYADLGFSIFLSTGAIPGEAGRGGTSMETNVQFVIERWKHRQRNILRWFRGRSHDIAMARQDKDLLKYLPSFTVDQIGVEQTNAIKDRMMPYYMAGLLSPQTALQGGGLKYATEVQNKQEADTNKELFAPPQIYNQTATTSDGETKETKSGVSLGRPPASQAPVKKAKPKANVTGGSPVSDRAYDWSSDITDKFSKISSGMDVIEFTTWMRGELITRLEGAYRDGMERGGSHGAPDVLLEYQSPQGINYHLKALEGFAHDLVASTNPSALGYRATLYSGASRTLYLLGYQQAMREQGARAWQRITHPELSESGPCAECLADEQNVHPISESYFEFHPHGACTVQSMLIHFGDKPRMQSPIPDYGMPTEHTLRRYPTRSE